MTIREFIAKLSKLDPELPVVMSPLAVVELRWKASDAGKPPGWENDAPAGWVLGEGKDRILWLVCRGTPEHEIMRSHEKAEP